MHRKPTTVRLSEAERDVLRAAARKTGVGYTTLVRRAALDHAADVLARELRRTSDQNRKDSGGR